MATLSPITDTPITTLGMQVDALLDQIDSLSSTQLYAIIVAVTVVISFVLLGTHPQQDPLFPADTTASTATPSLKKAPAGSNNAGPEPRWHIFRWVNYVAITAFFASVAEFGWNASTYLHQSDSTVLLQFLVGWSLFLCYFFGFFGVSFVHDIHTAEDNTANEQQQQQQVQQEQAQARYVVYLYLSFFLYLSFCVLLSRDA
jgi:hypothetical protein